MGQIPSPEEMNDLVSTIIAYRDKVTDLLKSLMDMDPTSLSPTVLIDILGVLGADQDVITIGQRLQAKYPNMTYPDTP